MQQAAHEYLYKVLSPKGDNDFWPEQIDGMGKNAPSLDRLIAEIEDHERDGYRLACVFRIECIDHEYRSENITAEVEELLSDRDKARRAERRDEYRFGDRLDHARALQKAE